MADLHIEIRDAVLHDIEQIASLWRHYVTTTIVNLEETPPTTRQVRTSLDSIFARNYPFIVATDGTTICGYAYIGPFNDRSGYRFCCEDSIYLHPDYTGKGVGKRLLGELLQRVKSNTQMTQVLAKISLGPGAELREVPSCRLHQSFGFWEAGRMKRVGFKFGEWLDVVILQLDLKDSV